MIADWEKNDKKEFEELFSHDNADISFIEVQNYKCLNEFKITGNIPMESYFRLFIPEELPDDIEQVIYLDGDIIVEGDIKELWEIPINDNAVLWNDWSELPYEWNVMTALFNGTDYKKINISEKMADDLMKYPQIIHYTNSKEKPWKDSCQPPLNERFEFYKEFMLNAD